MARNYTLDKDAAMDANNGGKRIKDSGPYVGRFKAAWYEQNDKGTESVQFLFESASGQEAGPLALYTHNSKGEELPSYKTLNAILTCLRVKTMDAQRGRVELYDFDSRSTIAKDKETYPALVGKDIGLFLQQEEYTNRDGEIKERMVIVGPFDAKSTQMADEILRQDADAKAYPRMADWLEKNPVKKVKGARANAATAGNSAVDDSFDDTIPF
jgi:hypothetical protein